MKSLADRTVLISGGAGGIGQGLAKAFAKEGARLLLADVDGARLDQAAKRLSDDGATVATAELDVTDFSAWQALVERAPALVGPVDVLCNNAGLGSEMREVAVHDPAPWVRVIQVNLIGYFFGARAVLPQLLERGGEGHIVNIASLSGLRANAAMSAYGASKHGVVGLSDALREELAKTSVGVSVVYPGMTRTDFIANSRTALSGVQGHAAGAYTNLDDKIAALLAASMNPDKLGARIVRAVLDSEYHVFTHVGARAQIERIFQERLDAFGENADPDYVDDVSGVNAAVANNAGAGLAGKAVP